MKLHMFDLDDVLIKYDYITDNHILFDDTIKILEYIKNEGSISIAVTHNYEYDKILKRNEIYNYFDYIDCNFDYSNKKNNLTKMLLKYNTINISDITFYDDLSENVYSGKQLGIKSYKINPNKGLLFDDFISWV